MCLINIIILSVQLPSFQCRNSKTKMFINLFKVILLDLGFKYFIFTQSKVLATMPNYLFRQCFPYVVNLSRENLMAHIHSNITSNLKDGNIIFIKTTFL